MEIEGIKIKWIGHSGFLIETSKIIYIDPYNLRNDMPEADFIFLTHSHYDSCSYEDLQKIVRSGTVIIATPDCQSRLTRFKVPVQLEIIEPGEEFVFGSLSAFAIPAYNVDKHFHKKDENLVGYVLKFKDLIIYHAGDTDVIPEMQKLTGYRSGGKTFVALLPVGGRFTMTPEEASNAAKIIKPDLAIPMRYGGGVGSLDNAEEFKELCEESGIRVAILEKS